MLNALDSTVSRGKRGRGTDLTHVGGQNIIELLDKDLACQKFRLTKEALGTMKDVQCAAGLGGRLEYRVCPGEVMNDGESQNLKRLNLLHWLIV